MNQSGTVQPHPGFKRKGAGGILDDPMFGSADFKAAGYRIARVHITTAPFLTGIFSEAGAVKLTWTKAAGPYTIQKKIGISDSEWMDVATTTEDWTTVPAQAGSAFFRVANQARIPVILNGASERPDPNSTTASGFGILQLDGGQLTVDLNYGGLSGPATAAHIHGPASSDQTAGVLIDLKPIHQGLLGMSGKFSGVLNLTSSQASALLGGKTYVNVHTSKHPAGEIRGQVLEIP